MTVFDTIANLLEYGNNGDVILWNTFMSEMWDAWLVVSAHRKYKDYVYRRMLVQEYLKK